MVSPAAILRFDGPPPSWNPPQASRLAGNDRWLLYFEGRIDNREELAGRLGMPAGTDVRALMLAALDKWDHAAPASLAGDFACIAWNIHDRRALLARDHLGIRTLYFAADRHGLVADPEMSPVLAQLPSRGTPDEETAAQFLSGDLENGSRTLFREISRVPPGHVVSADVHGVRCTAYWTAEPRTLIRYADDNEYEAHCRELLVTAVACRTDRGSTAVSLSGGLDSSALTVVSHLMVRGESAVRPFSLIFPEHPYADEQRYIDAVSERIGVPAVKVRPAQARIETFAEWTKRWRDVPPLPADAAAMPLWTAMARGGSRVAFTGAGGDYLFCGTPYHYADLVRAGAFVRLAREWRANRSGGRSPGLKDLAVTGFWPALPIGVKRALRPLARRAAGASPVGTGWLELRANAEHPLGPPRGNSFATEALVRDLTSGMHAYFLQSASRAAATAGIELRYPLLDVRLVEFLLAIPEDQRRRTGIHKWLLRRTLVRELPEAIASRTTKADFSHVALEAFESAGSGFFGSLRLAELGWVSGGAIVSMFQRMRERRASGDPDFGDDVPALWAVMALELWIRAL